MQAVSMDKGDAVGIQGGNSIRRLLLLVHYGVPIPTS